MRKVFRKVIVFTILLVAILFQGINVNAKTVTSSSELNPIKVGDTFSGKYIKDYNGDIKSADITISISNVVRGAAAKDFATKNDESLSASDSLKYEFIKFDYSISYKNIVVKGGSDKSAYADIYFHPHMSILSDGVSLIGGDFTPYEYSTSKVYGYEKFSTGCKPSKSAYKGTYLGVVKKGAKNTILEVDIKPYSDYDDTTKYVYMNLNSNGATLPKTSVQPLGFSTSVDLFTAEPESLVTSVSKDTWKLYYVTKINTLQKGTKISTVWYNNSKVIGKSSTTVDSDVIDRHYATYMTRGSSYWNTGKIRVVITGTLNGKTVFTIDKSCTVK